MASQLEIVKWDKHMKKACSDIFSYTKWYKNQKEETEEAWELREVLEKMWEIKTTVVPVVMTPPQKTVRKEHMGGLIGPNDSGHVNYEGQSLYDKKVYSGHKKNNV